MKEAVEILCNQAVVLQLLKDGYLWQDHFAMYGEVITRVFNAIYEEKNPYFAIKLAQVNLAQKNTPPRKYRLVV